MSQTPKRIGYYNANPHAVNFNTRFGPLFLDPNQIIRNNKNEMVASDEELDIRVKQGILKVLHEGESESTLTFRPVKKTKPSPTADRVVVTSAQGAIRDQGPTVRVSAQVPPSNARQVPNPTMQELVEARESTPPNIARVSAADRAHIVDEAENAGVPDHIGDPKPNQQTAQQTHPPARKVSDVIEVNEVGVPLDITNNADGTVTFEGNNYMSVGAVIKLIEASGRKTKVVLAAETSA